MKRARIESKKTISRAENSKPVYLRTINAIANAFSVTLAQIADIDQDQQVVFVNTSTLPGAVGRILAVPYHPERIMASFLDDVWFPIKNVVQPFTYGRSWVVREAVTGKVFDAGRWWAKRNGLHEDNRALQVLGIAAGDQLEVVSVNLP